MSWEKYRKVKKKKYVSIEQGAEKRDKNGNESVVTIFYKINFIGSANYMATSLSNIVDNHTEESCKTKSKDCDCFLEYESF